MKPTLFLSDMHLDPSRPQITQLFIRYLLEQGRLAREVYLLGDIFEAWIGDDAVPADHPVLAAIRQLSDSGVPVFVMRGNRDFLLGADFAEATGTTLLDDPTVIELDGEKVLLMHGDLLCTDDVEYQQFRAMVNDPQWQAGFLAKSIDERLAMAKQARDQSASRNSQLAAGREQIMDVNPQAVVETMRKHGVHRLIHGHTHRPDIHHFRIDGKPAIRIVLGDWFDQGSVLEVMDGRYDLQTLPG
ncbi:UDP-2,3-diacylglucosamine diphosphatase [Methylonatrum kenyense]|uniref:UDP-2,3-diacylglucosamine diphosphatase n=1 Tax=Methylonatrum kenyense TaxID=455253 RepID=UPI0020BE733C|nr:UDP-2,3-diacylglucosamine diphosphatase [Methylonatrum kenyense]MCK8517334.1 UDP-2,3-diacylglucosamine diphosphatase [Methylonatrum kenyense]